MTKNELELIDIIRTSEDPQKSMVTAIDIICQYIAEHCDKGASLDFCKHTS